MADRETEEEEESTTMTPLEAVKIAMYRAKKEGFGDQFAALSHALRIVQEQVECEEWLKREKEEYGYEPQMSYSLDAPRSLRRKQSRAELAAIATLNAIPKNWDSRSWHLTRQRDTYSVHVNSSTEDNFQSVESFHDSTPGGALIAAAKSLRKDDSCPPGYLQLANAMRAAGAREKDRAKKG